MLPALSGSLISTFCKRVTGASLLELGGTNTESPIDSTGSETTGESLTTVPELMGRENDEYPLTIAGLKGS